MNKIFFKKKRKTCLFVNFFLALFRCWCEKTLARTQEQVLNSAVLCLGLYRLLCFIRLPTIRGYVRAVWWVFTGFCFLATQSGNELELVSLWLSHSETSSSSLPPLKYHWTLPQKSPEITFGHYPRNRPFSVCVYHPAAHLLLFALNRELHELSRELQMIYSEANGITKHNISITKTDAFQSETKFKDLKVHWLYFWLRCLNSRVSTLTCNECVTDCNHGTK